MTAGAPSPGSNIFEGMVDFFDAARESPPHRELSDLAWEFAAAGPAGPLLDVGCGAGVFLDKARASGRRAFGTDLAVGMVRRAHRHGHAAAASDVAALPFPDATFAVATAMLVLHLVPDAHAALAELARVLVPGGRLVVVTQGLTWDEPVARALSANRGYTGVSHEFVVGSARSGAAHRRFDPDGLSASFDEAGFTTMRVTAGLDGHVLVGAANRR
ncbi:MAG: hypothetical protein RIS21_28 [Planctomycetota bacterium]